MNLENEADKKRLDSIRQHLNKYHKETLAEYLLHYKKIKTDPESCEVESIDASGLTIRYKKLGTTVAIDFPRKALYVDDVRKILDNMLDDTFQGLGKSRVQIKDYRLSAGQALSSWLTVSFVTSGVVSMLGLNQRLFSWFFFPFTVTIHDSIKPDYRTYAIVAIPLLNALGYFFLLRPLVYRHRVPKEKSWSWFNAYMIGSLPAYLKFQELVRETEKAGLGVSIRFKRD
ncbi:hypothetical protein CPB86DRAFT_191577 [Serendipita vermifera]|nr:hypothetical protein CPB86DRAFT_191577 [Serendipita vermifera]